MNAAAGGYGPISWREMIAFGLGLLRLPPGQFWSLTVREFSALAGLGSSVPGSLGRCEFESMMRQFPDRTGTGHER